jgi:hypothetical protein
MSGFLTVGPEERRSVFRNVLFSVFIFGVTTEKVLEEVYEDFHSITAFIVFLFLRKCNSRTSHFAVEGVRVGVEREKIEETKILRVCLHYI